MAGAGPSLVAGSGGKRRVATRDPAWVRWSLCGVALVFLTFFLALPLVLVFAEAFAGGWRLYLTALVEPYAWNAVKLTLLVAAISVPLNTLFGVCASWAIAKFRFKGRSVLLTLIDLPFAVSPVVAGLVFVLLFGAQGWFGPWLRERELQVIFAVPGIVLATLFVTFPFVARELIPLMEAQGSEQEEAARVLGASGWQTFWRVTLPNIKWGLLYGIILCNARAMGEYGAVAVVSSRIRGSSLTIPLEVEMLYNEYNGQAAFAIASLLAVLGVVTLAVKEIVGQLARRSVSQDEAPADTNEMGTRETGTRETGTREVVSV